MFIGAISLLMLLLLALSFMGPVSKESRVISQEGAKPSVGPGTPEVVFESSSMDGLQDLIRRLQATGVEVVRHESVEQPFFSVPGEIITLNFESVQIFDFGSSDKAEAEAANVLPDGRTFRSPNLKLNWSATPYFYLSGRLIVLYVGEDEEVMDILEILLGEPFAGGGGSTSN
jgi:hypothetical protein